MAAVNAGIDQDFETLPVEEFKNEILEAVRQNQVIICIGETGSGKTTQIPQFLLESGFCNRKMVGVTQPRRIAAISVTERVCDERKCRVGDEVGYSVRFDDKTTKGTKLKFMTDGILIRESLSDASLSLYSVIMLDEAHERSLNTDILFGLLKSACRTRLDLKIVITSATLDSDKFSNFFGQCPVIHIPGRVYPVDIYHSKTKQVMTISGPANNSYVQAAVDVVLRIHRKDDDGHILVFLTGQDEIERMCAMLRTAMETDALADRELIILPLYAALPNDVQTRVFKKPSVLAPASSAKLLRKVVVATNIAETSITVPHVRFVVDAGYVKQKVFDPARGMESLIVVPVSKTAALQRAGRAGRTGPGQCYRLYSSECFDNMLDETIPEIQRTNLANTILYLKALGIQDVLSFDFLDPPSQEQVLQALVLLHKLHALDDLGGITALGRKMSSYPLDPHISRVLIEASHSDCQCLPEAIIICAMLCVENVWVRPASSRQRGPRERGEGPAVKTAEEERADIAHAGLRHPLGDFLTLLNVFRAWERSRFSSEWCLRNYINLRSMKTAKMIREHLTHDVEKNQLQESHSSAPSESVEKRMCNALTAGYYMNAAMRCANESVYKCVQLSGESEDVRLVHISPQSAFHYCDPPEYVIYQELVHSTKLNMRMIGRASKSCLKEHQRRWTKVPAAQLSSGRRSADAAAPSSRKRPWPVENESNDAGAAEAGGMSKEGGGAGEAAAAMSQQAADAVLAAKQRYLNRKMAVQPPKKR